MLLGDAAAAGKHARASAGLPYANFLDRENSLPTLPHLPFTSPSLSLSLLFPASLSLAFPPSFARPLS